MTLLEAEPRVESQDNGETAYQTAKEVLKKYPEVKGILGTFLRRARHRPRHRRTRPQGQSLHLQAPACLPPTRRSSGRLHVDPDLWDPADAGYAMASLATKILNGEKIEDGVNLGVKGYESMHFSEGSTKVLEGNGWIRSPGQRRLPLPASNRFIARPPPARHGLVPMNGP